MKPFVPAPEMANVRLFVFVAFGGSQPGAAVEAAATRGVEKRRGRGRFPIIITVRDCNCGNWGTRSKFTMNPPNL